VVTFVEKQSGYIPREAEWLHLCRTRIVTFVERQSDYVHLLRRRSVIFLDKHIGNIYVEADLLHIWKSRVVTFWKAEWLHSSNFFEYNTENPGECFVTREL
jgi:hypothetical protein